jgi:hypothetical protein
MAEGQYDFTIKQGQTLTKHFAWKDEAGTLIDTAGYTASLQARATADSDTTLIDLSSAGGGITVGIGTTTDGFQYNVRLNMTSVETLALTWPEGQTKVPYDLRLSGGGVVTYLLEGYLSLKKAVTR